MATVAIGTAVLACMTPAVAGAWTFETPEWPENVAEWGQREAARQREGEAKAAHLREEEEKAAVAHELEVRQQLEVEAREREEARVRERDEERAQEREEARTCVVPAIVGESLPDARRALRKAHCRLGKVSYRRSRYDRGAWRVVVERPSPGKRLNGSSAVAITVSRSREAQRRRTARRKR